MKQKIHLQTVNIEDFVQGSLTLKEPETPQILGMSATITVKKTDTGVIISSPRNENGALIKNFIISLIPSKNEDKPNKFLCNFNWTINSLTTKYRLYKNGKIVNKNINNCFKYNFQNEKNGEYTFKVDCIQQSNFIQSSQYVSEYIYPYLNIPVLFNYKYFFYYYIENKDEDDFAEDILTPIPIDTRAAYLIYNNKNENLELEDYVFTNMPAIKPIENKGVFISDQYIYFTKNDYTKANNPPMYLLLKLNKILGSKNNILPDIKKIYIYVEPISEDDEDIDINMGGEESND